MQPGRSVYLISGSEEVASSIAGILGNTQFETRCFDGVGAFAADARILAHGCVLVDVKSVGMNRTTHDFIESFGVRFPIMAVVDYEDIDLATAAILHGATGILLRPLDERTLLRLLDRALSKSTCGENETGSATRALRSFGLSPRQSEVLDAIVEGCSNKIVGYKLCISPRTVEIHRAQIMRKLGARNVADLVRIVTEARLHSGESGGDGRVRPIDARHAASRRAA